MTVWEMKMWQIDHTLVVKDPAINAVLFALWTIFMIAAMVGFWVGTERIKAARESGHRYWLINPRAIRAGYRAMNWKLWWLSIFIGLLAWAAFFVIAFWAAEPL